MSSTQTKSDIRRQVCPKILIVDDDKGVCDVLSVALLAYDYEIVVASDGETALGLLESEKPDVVILDIRMPGVDGFEFLRRANPSFDSSFSVIAISGDVKEEEITECYSLGASVLIWKPFNIMEIRKVVEREIKTRHIISAMSQEHLRYRTLLEASPDIIFMLDREERCLFVNKNAAMFLRLSPEEAIGRKQSELFNPETAKRQSQSISEVLQTGKMLLRETNVEHQDGRKSWIESRIVPMSDEKGVVTGVLGLVRNVTERKELEHSLRESEERFRLFFECASIGMGMTDLKGNIIKVNPAFCRMLGYAEAELMAKTIDSITFPEDIAPSKEAFLNAINGSNGEYQMEKRYIDKEGKLIWVHIYASLIRDQEGNPKHFIAQIEDISMRKKAEQQLQSHKAYLSVLADIRGMTLPLPIADIWTAFLNDLAQTFDLAMAWYGNYENDKIIPAYWSHGGEKCLKDITLDIQEPDSPDTKSAMSRAILSRDSFGYGDLENDEGFKKWRHVAIACGYRSNFAVPVMQGASVIGGVMLYSREKNAFEKGVSNYLHDLIREMAGLHPPRNSGKEQQGPVLK
ncbi:MAG: hypothetical protein A2X49_09085 [Lentisphaerae bacterium GWF2_52_8]|nr:MAG: hypothetical protein A2X49_09085 [Lentisphaerae bacterium GWF2_52_8]